MSAVKLSFLFAPTDVAASAAVASFAVSTVGSDGVAQSATIALGQLQAQTDGTFVATVDIADGVLPVGAFSGSIQALDASATAVGTSVSYSGEIPAVVPVNPVNLQPIPVSVTVTVA
jgi:hypothetical protein